MPRLLLALSLLLAGCTVGPDYQRPAPSAATQAPWLEPGTPGAVDLAWWDSFGDPQLSALVTRALASAPDLREAEARLAEARANRDAVAGGRLPSVQATGSATENRLSENGQLPIGNIPGVDREFRLFDLGFDASWELDFWGRRTRQTEAANARADAALYGQRDVMLTLIGEVARSYFDLRAAQADAATARALAASDTELARLTQLRFNAGEASRLELERAEGAARSSAAAVPDAEARAAAAAYRIAALVGAAPEEVAPELRKPAPLPALTASSSESAPNCSNAAPTSAAPSASLPPLPPISASPPPICSPASACSAASASKRARRAISSRATARDSRSARAFPGRSFRAARSGPRSAPPMRGRKAPPRVTKRRCSAHFRTARQRSTASSTHALPRRRRAPRWSANVPLSHWPRSARPAARTTG
jgi:hypothetical protein